MREAGLSFPCRNRVKQMNNQDVLVLVVDDNPVVREMLRANVVLEGYRVETAGDGMAALEKIAQIQPDVVLLDVMMPGMNGFEVTRRVKNNPVTILIPVILITALDSRQERMKGIEAGADDFLSKPIDRLQLLTRLATVARLRRVSRELDDAETVLESLARSIEAKDATTGSHCDRLMEEAVRFGEFIGLLPRELRALRRAAVLHDIGKIGIPEAILLKPGKLDPAEWQVMKTHTEIGEQLLAPLRTMEAVRAIARHHHESWDGNGYPDGLTGTDIPYLVRVFQIIDAFDALTHERPYREAMTPQAALALLQQEAMAGKWDPALLDAYIDCKCQEGICLL